MRAFSVLGVCAIGICLMFGANLSTLPALASTRAEVSIHPNTLNLESGAKWITAYIELPEDYDVRDVDVSSIMLNGAVPVDSNAPTQIGDYDSDCVPDLMVKFKRKELALYIYSVLGMDLGDVTLTVSGQLIDGTKFEGFDTVWVMPGCARACASVGFTLL